MPFPPHRLSEEPSTVFPACHEAIVAADAVLRSPCALRMGYTDVRVYPELERITDELREQVESHITSDPYHW